jgi:hypothetical protein
MRGTTYATLGDGKIVIGDRPGKTGPSGEILENPLALATINRDPAGRQVVTINESTKVSLDIPVLDFRKIADDARSATDLMRALTTPVPDDVAAMGEAASDYYRRLIAGGASFEAAQNYVTSPEFGEWSRAVDELKRDAENPNISPENIRRRDALIAQGIQAGIDDAGKLYVLQCGGGASWCQKIAVDPKMGEISAEKLKGIIAGSLAALSSTKLTPVERTSAQTQLYFALRCAMSWSIEGGTAEQERQFLSGENRELLTQAALFANSKTTGPFMPDRLNNAMDLRLAVLNNDPAQLRAVIAEISAQRAKGDSLGLQQQETIAREALNALEQGDIERARALTGQAMQVIATVTADHNPLLDILLAALPTVRFKGTPKPKEQGGPGQWATVEERASPRAQAYQQEITGRPFKDVYEVPSGNSKVKFDGYENGQLIEAKGPGYGNFFDAKGTPKPWYEGTGAKALEDQMANQVKAAGNRPIVWYVAEENAMMGMKRIAAERVQGGSNITFIHKPPAKP